MVSYRFGLFVFSFCFVVYYTHAAMTQKQIESGKRMILNICKPRTNVTDDALESLKAGNFAGVTREAMCFINCALVSNRWQNKDNTFNMANGLASLKMLPEAYQEEGKQVMETCKDAAKTLDDKCVSALELAKCFYDNSKELKKLLA